MPDYKIRAVDSNSIVTDMVRFAKDIGSLEAIMQKESMIIIEAKEVSTTDKKDFYLKDLLSTKITRRELAEFSLQLSTLLGSGVTVLDSLKTLSDDAPNIKFSKVLIAISRDIEAGSPLYQSFGKYANIFPDRILYMIKAGETGGKLPDSLNRAGSYLEWLDGLLKDIKQATIYPVVIMIAVILFITVLFTFVIPKFIKILEGLNVPLPLITKIVIWVSGTFTSYWWLIAGSIFTVVISIKLLKKRSSKFKYFWDKMKISLPVFGDLNKMFAISRFSQTFASLFDAGIGVLETLDLCMNVTGNDVYEAVIKKAREDLKEGVMLSESLRKSNLFTSMNIRMITVGESLGDLGMAMNSISSYYNDEIPRKVKTLFGILEPAMTLCLIVTVGFVALSVMMPLFSMIGGIK